MTQPKDGEGAEALLPCPEISAERVKLTKAQRELLERLEAWGPGPADAAYRPARVLLRLGLVTKEVRRNKMRLHIFTITEAGRAALAGDHS